MRDKLQSKECARVLKALADPDRLRLIQCLQAGPRHVRQLALKRLRRQIAIACDAAARGRAVDRVARLALAAIDGAFVAASAAESITLTQILEPLPDALVAARRALPRARSHPDGER